MTIGRATLGILFIGAGLMHFVATPAYVRIMPPSLPQPDLLVAISGLCEVLGGAGLLLSPTRRFAAWALVALLIAVFPANFHMAIDRSLLPQIPAWMLWARLPLQLPLIFWAWLYTRK